MYTRRRATALLLACVLLLTYRSYWIQHGDGRPQNTVILGDLRDGRPVSQPWKDVFPPGQPKPAGSEYTRTVVISSMSIDNISWVDHELSDLFEPAGSFKKAIYVADNSSAPLHPKKNKGHEAMIYLSYIIDHYDKLPDVSIFIHSDRWTWHNNELLDNDMAAMVRYLKPEKVVKDGYMNLRCHWDPGCPNWLLLWEQGNQENIQKHEEKAIAERWHELFPMDRMPAMLSQPCCAQFALSRERILAIPLQRYIFLRSWILRTPLEDYFSGRVFEYLWQYIFTGNAEVCPAMHECYCEGYGMCFGGPEKFDEWFALRMKKQKHESQILRMKKGAKDAAKDSKATSKPDLLDMDDEEDEDDEDEDDSDKASGARMAELQQKVNQMKQELAKLRDNAFLLGHPDLAKEAGLKVDS